MWCSTHAPTAPSTSCAGTPAASPMPGWRSTGARLPSARWVRRGRPARPACWRPAPAGWPSPTPTRGWHRNGWRPSWRSTSMSSVARWQWTTGHRTAPTPTCCASILVAITVTTTATATSTAPTWGWPPAPTWPQVVSRRWPVMKTSCWSRRCKHSVPALPGALSRAYLPAHARMPAHAAALAIASLATLAGQMNLFSTKGNAI